METYIVKLIEIEEYTETLVILESREQFFNLVRDLDREKYQLEDVQIINSPVHYSVDFFIKKGIDGLETGHL